MKTLSTTDRAAKAIDLKFDEYTANNYLTHNLHPYPAKFIPQIPREVINRLTQPGDWVLDPFNGSGTTLVECGLLGRNGIGTDINPLACKIANAKISRFNNDEVFILREFLSKVSSVDSLNYEMTPPKFFGIDKWFSPKVKMDLTWLLRLIRDERDEVVKNFLEVVFSAVIVRVSNQESDTRYKAIEKKLPDDAVKSYFCSKLQEAIDRTQQYALSALSTVKTEAYCLDSTKQLAPNLNEYKLIITSPPYMNSYDYYLYHKHRMNWLGLDVINTQEKEFGSRNKHNDLGLGLDAYNEAVMKTVNLTKAVLIKNGYYCVIVGDAIWRGELIKMNDNYDAIFRAAGFRKVNEIIFPQRKYTKTFTNNLRTQYKNSYVLIYTKE